MKCVKNNAQDIYVLNISIHPPISYTADPLNV